MKNNLGIVVGGSALEGVKILLSPEAEIEDIEVGSLGIIKSKSGRDFLTMVEDISYDVKDASVYREASHPILEDGIIKYMRDMLMDAYIHVIILAYREGGSIKRGGKIPGIGSRIHQVSDEDIIGFYGREDWREYYPLGYPKVIGESSTAIPISLNDLFNLNFGIFGKAGTGKTYLANLLISYTTLYNYYASASRINLLVFDMQGEYSFDLLDDRGNVIGPGVGKAFRDEFDIYVIDEDYLKIYNYVKKIRIPLYNLTREEFEIVIEPLNPPEGFKSNLSALKKIITNVIRENIDSLHEAGIHIDEKDWILGFMITDYNLDRLIRRMSEDRDFIEFNGDIDRIREALAKLYNSLVDEIREAGKQALLSSFDAGSRRISAFLELPVSFIQGYSDEVDEIIEKIYHSEGGHVMICFGGRWSRTIPLYMALANLIAYRLKNRIDTSVVRGGEENRKIVIFLEEAHRFLGRGLYQYNPFGKLAREYRKFGVSVVPIDQKPSELDPDVTSMLWTKIVFNLSDPRDIESALLGIEDEGRYRKIVPLLGRGEALIYGVGIKVPAVLKIVNYTSIIPILSRKYEEARKSQQTTKDLYG